MTKTVGILILDDDILLADANLKYVIQELRSLRYQIKKVAVIPGDESSFLFEVEHLLKQNDFVLLINHFKSNFVYEALANLFKDDLIRSSEATIPARSKLLECENSVKVHPIIYTNRLFIVQDDRLPIVFDDTLKSYFKQFNEVITYKKNIFIRTCEDTASLNNTNNCVRVSCHREKDVTIVKAVSYELDKLLEFESRVMEKFGVAIGSRVCSNTVERIYSSLWFPQVRVALECIEKCLVDFAPENVFLSFNGGKDCTVLLHLVLVVLEKKFPEFVGRLVCMYVQSAIPFREVNSFIDRISQYYNLEIVTITKGVKEGLTEFLAGRPRMRACLMGTRSTDPFSENLITFQMTDANWPQVMRVSPLLHWHYADVWDYLLYFRVPYCCLYDEGYTSLGSVNNTQKNPDLLYGSMKGSESYLPAYRLIDGSKERSGRQ